MSYTSDLIVSLFRNWVLNRGGFTEIPSTEMDVHPKPDTAGEGIRSEV